MASVYKRPLLLFTPHLETIYPALLRSVDAPPYQRERIDTPDADFLDLDWLQQGSKKLVIISHGLEGNSGRAYMRGMATAAYTRGYDVLTWNFRGCSEEMNRQLRFYHSGATEDLDLVVRHAIKKSYTSLYLVGFSLGGNLTLKYLGERESPAEIKKAGVFSVPVDLHSSCLKISRRVNWVYSNRFLRSLKKKVIQKSRIINGLDIGNIDKVSTLIEFDDRFTAPLHGFQGALDYYKRCSAIHFLDGIRVPTLLVNAMNDPFLGEACFPRKQLEHNQYIEFETPVYGGHVGFAQFNKNGLYWSEERAMSFLSS